MLLFSAEERVQVDFIKKTYTKIKDCPQLDLVPLLLLHSNIGDQKDEQIDAHRSMMGQTIAQEIGIKIFKELNNDNMKEIIDTIMMTVSEPRKGLSD